MSLIFRNFKTPLINVMLKNFKTYLYIMIQILLILSLLLLSQKAGAVSSNHDLKHQEVLGHHESAPQTQAPAPHAEQDHIKQDARQHQEATPLIYLFYWGILILVMVVILVYFVIRYKRGQEKPVISLGVALVIFVLTAYLIEITPIFSGRFDPDTFKFVHEFHESPNLGFLRFMYKFLLGIFLTFFAFLNMNRKKFHMKLEARDRKSQENSRSPKPQKE